MNREKAVRAAIHVVAVLLALSLQVSASFAADEPAGDQRVIREGVPVKVANRQIMSPHYMMDPKEPQVVPRDKWHTPPAKAPAKP